MDVLKEAQKRCDAVVKELADYAVSIGLGESAIIQDEEDSQFVLAYVSVGGLKIRVGRHWLEGDKIPMYLQLSYGQFLSTYASVDDVRTNTLDEFVSHTKRHKRVIKAIKDFTTAIN